MDVEIHVPGAVRGLRARAEIGPPLEKLPREAGAGVVRIEVQLVLSRRRAVELPEDLRAGPGREVVDRLDDGEVLKAVSAVVGVAWIVVALAARPWLP